MTNGWTDVANADVVLVMGGNPAENHPVGFRFVMEAKLKRKARLVCVDPRFNRTAAVADQYVPIRSGSDIVFLGGLVNYALSHDLLDAEYLRLHTNAPFLIREGFGFEDGLFSGWDEQEKAYDKSSWAYELDGQGYARVDATLEHPRSVFQLLKKHYSRYTPETVAGMCGCTVAEFAKAAAVICSTAQPGRAGTILYALGWTQHSHSVQLIRTAAILQLILGNIGVAGGGVNAQRGHSNIQGATDMGAWNMLPGYLKMPRADQATLDAYLKANTPKPLRPNAMNYWSNTPKFMASLLASYYGTAAKDFGYSNLPKLGETDNFSWGYIFDHMYRGEMQGLMAFGMNPVANGPNTPKMLAALSKLKWLIVADVFETETAAFWKAKDLASNYYPGAPTAKDISTEVFLLPAACFAEKEGSFVNSSRWVQWKNQALDAPGEARPDQEIIARLYLKIRELYEKEGGTAPEPLLAMSWNYQNPFSPSLMEVAKEINGRDAAGAQVPNFGALAADGSTTCGNWLYAGSFTAAGNQMARRGQEDPSGLGLYADWSWNWPANRRVLYNRASADAQGRPRDPARPLLRWNGKAWIGDVPDYRADAAPETYGAFIMNPEGVARIFATDFVEGPFPEHYEPVESPCENALHPKVRGNPAIKTFQGDLDKLGTVADYPYIGTTYRLTEHFHYWTKHLAPNSQLQPHFFVEIPAELAREKQIASGDQVRVRSARGSVEGRALVTRRIKPLQVGGKIIYQIGMPIHWGFLGRVKGPLINNLSASVLDPNSGTPEYKGFLVNLEKL